MDNSKNMEPGIKDTAAFDSTNKESKSGIPHLHAVVCRVDENGNINPTSQCRLYGSLA